MEKYSSPMFFFSFKVHFIANKRGGKPSHFKAYKLLTLTSVPNTRPQPVTGMEQTFFFFFPLILNMGMDLFVSFPDIIGNTVYTPLG